MKNNFTKLFVLAIATFGFAFSSIAQNLYTESPTYYASFENTTTLYVTNQPQPAAAYNMDVSQERALNGSRSVKIYCQEASVPTGGNSTVILGGNDATTPAYGPGNVTLAIGDYTFKAKIYILDQAPKNIVIYIVEKTLGITNGVNLTIPLTGITTGSWQTFEGTFSITAAGDYKTGIRLRGIDFGSPMTGPVTCYIDNMEILAGVSTAVSNPVATNFNLYSTDKKVVISTNEASQIGIYNITGKLIKSLNLVNGTVDISTVGFSKGVYLAKVTSNGVSSTQKFGSITNRVGNPIKSLTFV